MTKNDIWTGIAIRTKKKQDEEGYLTENDIKQHASDERGALTDSDVRRIQIQNRNPEMGALTDADVRRARPRGIR